MFKYPEDDHQFILISSKQQIKRKLRLERQELNIKRQYFTILEIHHRYIYVKCRVCSIQLKYKYNADIDKYKITKFQNVHNHLSQRQNYFQNYLLSFPLSIELSSMRDIATKQLSISQSQFYYYWAKINKKQENFDDLLKYLEQNDHTTRYFPQISGKQLPDIMITCSKQMRSDFAIYGHCVSFDLTYCLVKQVNKDKKYGLGMMLGRNQNLKAVPFALVIMNTQTTQAMVSVFHYFFQMISGKPQTIITDMQPSIRAGLQFLKENNGWNGCHMWDSYHYLRSLSKKLKNNKQVLNFLKSCMFVQQYSEYESNLNQAWKSTTSQEQQKIVQQFDKNSGLTCLYRCKGSRWTNISTSYHQQCHDFLKKYLHYQKPFVQVVRRSLKLMVQLREKSKQTKIQRIKFQIIFQFQSLREIRTKVDYKIFNVVLKRLLKSLKLQFKQTSEKNFQFQNQNVKQIQINGQILLQCSCSLMKFQGLPCVHILKISQQFGQPISKYVNKKWFLKDSQICKQVSYLKKGRPRKSRRNRIK